MYVCICMYVCMYTCVCMDGWMDGWMDVSYCSFLATVAGQNGRLFYHFGFFPVSSHFEGHSQAFFRCNFSAHVI